MQGRQGWLREAKRQLDIRREQQPRPVPASRVGRLLVGEQKLSEDLAVEREANRSYEAWRARGVAADGSRRMAPGMLKPYVPPAEPAGKVNTTDPDSKNVKAFRGYVQGYNAQAVVTEQQIVIAAEVNIDPQDFSHLGPMVTAARAELERAGVTEPVGIVSRGRRLLALPTDGRARRRRDTRADPARRDQTQDPATRVGRRALRLDAPITRH